MKKHWWRLERRTHRENPFKPLGQPNEWYALRQYSDLSRARRGRNIEAGALGSYNGLNYFEWRIIDEETGEEVTE